MPKFYDHLDLRGNTLKNALLHVNDGAPEDVDAAEGQIYYDSGDDCLKAYDGSNWIEIADVNTYTALTNGGLAIDGSQQLSINFTNVTLLDDTPADADRIMIYDNNGTPSLRYVTYDDFIAGIPGDVTSVTPGVGLSGSSALTGAVTLTLDFGELADMQTDISGTTEFILLDSAAESRKAANEIKLSAFNNDSSWVDGAGAVSAVAAADDYLKLDVDDATTGVITAGGFTTTGDWTFDEHTSSTVTISTVQSSNTNTLVDLDTSLMTAKAIKAYVATTGGGTMDDWVLKDDDGNSETIGDGKHVKFVGGNGLSTDWVNSGAGTSGDEYDMQMSVNSTQSHITQIYNTSLKIGEDDETQIDFTTDNNIIFDVADAELAKFTDHQADFTVHNFNITSSNGSGAPILTIKNTNADALGPQLKFAKDSTDAGDGDEMGRISFFGTDSSENTEQELAYINATINDSADGSEAATMTFYVAEYDATRTAGLQIVGQPDDNGEVDVTIAAGVGSTTAIAGIATVGSNLAVAGAGIFGGLATTGTLTVGVDDTGHDVKFFGDTAGKYMEWDASEDQLDVTGSFDVTGNSTLTGTVGITGNTTVAGTFDVTGNSTVTGTLGLTGNVTVGSSGAGHTVKFYGTTVGNSFLWSGDTVSLAGDTEITFRGTNQNIHSSGSGNLSVRTQANDGALLLSAGSDNPNEAKVLLESGVVDIDATGAVQVDGAGVSIDSAGAAANLTVASDGAAEDLTISVTGATDSSLILSSTGTGTDAISIDATAGSMLIAPSLADAKTLKIGKTGAVEMIFAPSGTASGERWSITNTAGNSADAIKLDSVAGGVSILSANTSHGVKIATGTTGVPVTIGHSTSEVTVADNLNVNGDLDVAGDLTVHGTTTTVDSTTIILEDPILTLGGNEAVVDTNKDFGIEFSYDGENQSNPSVSVATNVATVTKTDHGYSVGSLVKVANSNLASMNGNYVISHVGTNTYRFSTTGVSNTVGSNPDSGSTYTVSRRGFFGYDDSGKAFTGFTNATNTSEVFDGGLLNATFGVGTFSSLGVSGDVNIDGTLEADAITIDDETITEVIQDTTAGQIVTYGSHTLISATYDDGNDGAIDLALAYKDEDEMTSDSASHVPTQQSVKAYVDATGVGGSVTSTIDINGTDGSGNDFTSTKFAKIAHSLDTLQPIVELWEVDDDANPAASERIQAKIECVSSSTVKISFAVVPSNNVLVSITKPNTNNIDPSYA